MEIQDVNFKVDGYIVNCNLTHEVFLMEFSVWLDSKGWGFTGMTLPAPDTEEEYLSDMDRMFTDGTYKRKAIFTALNDEEQGCYRPSLHP